MYSHKLCVCISVSQIDQQWRIVSSYTVKGDIAENLVNKPRPLEFDQKQHKMLNSELKLLYTAITRARSKLWIFDDSSDKRAPMFCYFMQKSLVEYLSYPTSEVSKPITSFANRSSSKQWKKQGDSFRDKSQWNLAVMCYNKANIPLLSKDALGHHYVHLAAKQKHRYHYLTAANYFSECFKLQQSAEYLEKTASCLYNAHQFESAAELFAKIKVYLYTWSGITHVYICT